MPLLVAHTTFLEISCHGSFIFHFEFKVIEGNYLDTDKTTRSVASDCDLHSLSTAHI